MIVLLLHEKSARAESGHREVSTRRLNHDQGRYVLLLLLLKLLSLLHRRVLKLTRWRLCLSGNGRSLDLSLQLRLMSCVGALLGVCWHCDE